MSFGLGFLAGMGRSQRDYNQRQVDQQLQAEQTKNKATADLLHDFMLRDDVTPEVRQAALSSLMSFSQTQGMPTQKHRSTAMEPLLAAFNTPRQYVSPDTQNMRTRGRQTADMGAGMQAAAAGPAGESMFAGADWMGGEMSRMGSVAASTPGESRSGFLRPDEQAQIKGRAAGLQMRSLTDTMSGGNGGMTVDGPGGSKMVMMPDGKFRLINPSMTNENYQRPDGTVGNRTFDHRTGEMVDSETGEPAIGPRWSVGGYSNVQTLDPGGRAVTQRVSRLDGGSYVKPIPTRERMTTDASGHQYITSTTPGFNGNPSAVVGQTQVGQQPNVDINRERIANSIDVSRRGIDLRERGLALREKQFALGYDPSQYPDGVPLPPGMPTDEDGNAIGLREFAATKEPGSVLQRASAGRSVMHQAEDVAKMVEDPKNADLMGRVSGRVNELLVEGPQTFATKWIGPIGTNDPNLAALHAAVKSISDLLTTVHGRRAEEAAKSFAATMKLVHSPESLAAAIRQYAKVAENIASEGGRPITSTTRKGGGVTPRSNQLPSRKGKPLDRATAEKFYKQAGGDPVKARQLAIAAGYEP